VFEYQINENLSLKLLEKHHAKADFECISHNRTHLKKWLPWLNTTTEVSDVENFIDHTLRMFVKGTDLTMGIWVASEFAGVISLMDINKNHQNASIGYWLSESHGGQGIMTLACEAMLRHAFEELALHRVEIRCAEKNVKSGAIPERLGFVNEGRIRDAEYLYDHFVTHVVYGMLKTEWETRSNHKK